MLPLSNFVLRDNPQEPSVAHAAAPANIENPAWCDIYGLPVCPHTSQDAGFPTGRTVCTDKLWVMDCMFRLTSALNGSRSEYDIWADGELCSAGADPEDAPLSLWDTPGTGMRDRAINSCHRCIDGCWYNWQLNGSPQYMDCVESGGAPGISSCKAHIPDNSYDVYATADAGIQLNWSCAIQSWVDGWQYPTGDAAKDKLCTMACRKDPKSDTVEQACFDACMANTLPGVIAWIKDPANNANDAQEAIQHSSDVEKEEIRKLNLGDWMDGDSLSALIKKLKCVGEDTGGVKGFCGHGSVSGYVSDIMTIGSVVFGGLAMLKIIFGGVLYATAAGNPGQISTAKEHIKYALIGITLILGMNIILMLLGATTY